MLVKSPVAVSTSLPSGRLAAMSPADTGTWLPTATTDGSTPPGGVCGAGCGKRQVVGNGLGGAGPPLRQRLLKCRPAAPWRQAGGGGVQVGHVGVELGPRSCQGDGACVLCVGIGRHSVLLYLAAAVSGAVAGSGARWALRSADTDVMCRANSSGTAAAGISASGSSLIGAPDGVTLISWNPVRAPRVRATTRSVMPNALNHRAARRPVPCARLRATSGAAIPAAMSPRPAGRANSAGR